MRAKKPFLDWTVPPFVRRGSRFNTWIWWPRNRREKRWIRAELARRKAERLRAVDYMGAM